MFHFSLVRLGWKQFCDVDLRCDEMVCFIRFVFASAFSFYVRDYGGREVQFRSVTYDSTALLFVSQSCTDGTSHRLHHIRVPGI